MAQPSIFISYSHEDEEYKEELVKHLRVLELEGLVDLWVDDEIGAGGDWEDEIGRAMKNARLAILLITKSFLGSDFIRGTEIPALLERRKSEGLKVFPLIARPCACARMLSTHSRARPSSIRCAPSSRRSVTSSACSHASHCVRQNRAISRGCERRSRVYR